MKSSIKVLIIDDEIKALDLLKVSIEEYGFTVVAATSGKDGLMQVQTFAPHIIVLDVRMPEMDGWEVCRELKKNPLVRDTPVIFLTALSDKREMVKAKSVGAALFLTKPIDPYYLANRIKNIVEEGLPHEVPSE
jgi:DNA-binding response OmpR family regulator